MSILKKTINLVVIFTTCFSVAFSVTSVDIQLNGTYRDFGFSRRESKLFCGELNGLIKQLFGFDRLKYRGVSKEALCSVIAAGLLIELSERGQDCIDQAAHEFADRANSRRFPLSDKATRLLRADVKRFAFSWIVERLNKYEKFSFYHAYTMQYEAITAPFEVADDFDAEPNDFEAEVITVEELRLSDEFGLLGIV